MEAILGIVITGLFGLAVEFVRRSNKKTRAENSEQHAAARSTIEAHTVAIAANTSSIGLLQSDMGVVKSDVSQIKDAVCGTNAPIQADGLRDHSEGRDSAHADA